MNRARTVASRRQDECERKIKRQSLAGSVKALVSLVERDARKGRRESMHIYQCPWCHQYHIGHRNPPMPMRMPAPALQGANEKPV